MTLRTLNSDFFYPHEIGFYRLIEMSLLVCLFMRIIELNFRIDRERERERKKEMLIQIFSFALDNRTQ